MTPQVSRRSLLVGLGASAALSLGSPALAQQARATPESLPPSYPRPPSTRPRIVPAPAGSRSGEVHVHPDDFALYWTLPDGTAIRYGCGIGRAGLYEPGEFYVGAKKEWPSWTPTPAMIRRDPDQYARWADGMPGGPENPLGARAIYLFTPERGDSFLRLHGTNAPETIGTAVSNGCARLVNRDIIDLYDRVPLNTRVVLHPQGADVRSPGSADVAAGGPFQATPASTQEVTHSVPHEQAPGLASSASEPSLDASSVTRELTNLEASGLW